ncbi:GNAT family N-acetyltransferase [Vibrio salinus]|uniref:GNAT family N-acetyltransferase n=1 Tax=Vibrio salinus TaxID=2899784 RepID=UPI001E2D77C0|nr:GNAT family N-acetyltransferase [Vibrio salinus]MCE0492465.1 GNAT family N-acetyltransferase [Vibrio salinus]
MTDFIIHSASRRDIKILDDLMHALHDEHHSAQPEFFKTADEIAEEKNIGLYLDEPDGLVFCAKQEDKIVGFITGHFSELTSTVSQTVFMGSIDELYVKPQFRGMGIGQALLKRIETELKDYGVKHIFVEVWAFNKTALDIYHSVGFKHHIHWLHKDI